MEVLNCQQSSTSLPIERGSPREVLKGRNRVLGHKQTAGKKRTYVLGYHAPSGLAHH